MKGIGPRLAGTERSTVCASKTGLAVIFLYVTVALAATAALVLLSALLLKLRSDQGFHLPFLPTHEEGKPTQKLTVRRALLVVEYEAGLSGPPPMPLPHTPAS